VKHFIAACLIACTPIAHAASNAASIEVGAGVARSTTQGDGIWYQAGLPHTLKLRSPAFLIGVTGDLTPSVAWHVDAVYLGSYSVDSWDTAADADYSPATHQCLRNCSNLAHFQGKGRVYGVAATLEAHTQGKWQVGIQAGPFLYRSSWSVQVPNYFAAAGWPADTTPEQVAPWGWMPGGLQRSKAGWRVGSVIGLTLRHDRMALSLARYNDGKGWPMKYSDGTVDGWPPLWKGQTVLMLTYKF